MSAKELGKTWVASFVAAYGREPNATERESFWRGAAMASMLAMQSLAAVRSGEVIQ